MSIKEMLKQVIDIKVELDGVVYPNKYADDLSIDRSDLETEFLEHAERYAYYATLSEMAEDRHVRLKEDMENLVAFIDHEKRMTYESMKQTDPKFKMTETMFDHEVKLDQRYKDKLKQLQDARHIAKVLKNAPLAFAHRRDMLLELAKAHMAGLSDPRIMQGRQQQVRHVLAGKAVSNQQAPLLPEPKDELLNNESSPIEIGPAVTGDNGTNPVSPVRRRTPKIV